MYEELRPIFVCFPRGVNLQWSTNTSIDLDTIKDGEGLTLKARVVESPLVSLVLNYFSMAPHASDTAIQDDILNRLPNMEYRCLSSYQLYAVK